LYLPESKRLLISDDANSQVLVYDLGGQLLARINSVRRPSGLLCTPEGRCYYASRELNRILPLDLPQP
jgi:hypothetical protein